MNSSHPYVSCEIRLEAELVFKCSQNEHKSEVENGWMEIH